MTELLLENACRAEVYKVLAECYYPLDEEMMAILSRPESSTPTPIEEIAREASAVTDIVDLRVDHAKLFVGPFKLLAPPYGSVYLDDSRLMGASTLDVKDLYAEEGLDLLAKEAPDHVSIELEFMQVLALKEIDALRKSDLQAARSCRRRQRSFLAMHLGRWVAAFADAIEQHARTDFYRTLGRVTWRFVEDDLEELVATDGQAGKGSDPSPAISSRSCANGTLPARD